MITLSINELLHRNLQIIIDSGGVIDYELDSKNYVISVIGYDQDDIVCLRASNRICEVWIVKLYKTPLIKWRMS